MSKIKNFYGANIEFPFMDWTPTSIWQHTANLEIEVNDPEDPYRETDNFGKFTPEAFQQLLKEWQEFKDEYYYDDQLAFHWWERKNPKAIEFFGELINSKQ